MPRSEQALPLSVMKWLSIVRARCNVSWRQASPRCCTLCAHDAESAAMRCQACMRQPAARYVSPLAAHIPCILPDYCSKVTKLYILVVSRAAGGPCYMACVQQQVNVACRDRCVSGAHHILLFIRWLRVTLLAVCASTVGQGSACNAGTMAAKAPSAAANPTRSSSCHASDRMLRT